MYKSKLRYQIPGISYTGIDIDIDIGSCLVMLVTPPFDQLDPLDAGTNSHGIV